MIPSTKLTLMVLALPITVLILSDVAIFYYYKTIDVSASIATIAVLLLVWERLRDSLSKKLQYLHKNVLFELYSQFEDARTHGLFYDQDEIKVARTDLERYGKFMVIPLYPMKLLERIDEFLSLHDTFYQNLQQITDLAEKKLVTLMSKDLLWYDLGFKPVSYSAPSPEEEKKYSEIAEVLVKEHSKLIDETKSLHENLKEIRKEIHDKLEDFLKSNNLILKPEPVSHISY